MRHQADNEWALFVDDEMESNFEERFTEEIRKQRNLVMMSLRVVGKPLERGLKTSGLGGNSGILLLCPCP